MAADTDQINILKSRINSISKWMNQNDLSKKANRKNLLNFLMQLDATTDASIGQLAEELGVPHDEIGFADFLSDIGDSVVATQRQLDEQSRVYLEQIKGNKHITPAIYRLPKVSASIKFGMRKSKGEGFNIIVAQRRKEDERTLNQSLDFEIISVPPPPDYQQTLSGEIPTIGFIFSPTVRQGIFSDIEKYQPKPEQTSLKKEIELLLASKNEVLMLQIGPRLKKGFDNYLILFANEEGEKNVGIWSLLRDPSGQQKPVFEIILKFTASNRQGENYKALRDIIVAHSKQQSKLLSS